ncbi:hypothetical protein [Actinokineospora inagensis]|uniref:hypothetical protein n=1 Tax=Actinokineospora inagensis TaxID=103730 RepID=UPI00047962C5|nr:hypothetical protein [Actinokineospora inagensis]
MTALVISAAALLLWAVVIWYGIIRRPRHVPSRSVVIGVVVALIACPVVAIASSWSYLACLDGGFDPGISRSDGECVGVTDGTYKFSSALSNDFGPVTRDALDHVESTIADQNAALDQSKPRVTVAFLAPFTSDLSGPRLVHQLEGAAAAQRQINKDRPFAIRLLLAHLGSVEGQWETVVDQVANLVNDSDQPLVAVMGLGLDTGPAG